MSYDTICDGCLCAIKGADRGMPFYFCGTCSAAYKRAGAPTLGSEEFVSFIRDRRTKAPETLAVPPARRARRSA